MSSFLPWPNDTLTPTSSVLSPQCLLVKETASEVLVRTAVISFLFLPQFPDRFKQEWAGKGRD